MLKQGQSVRVCVRCTESDFTTKTQRLFISTIGYYYIHVILNMSVEPTGY